MPFDLLAPVPLVHLLSAVESGMPEQVAFGSEKDRFFGSIASELSLGMRVWLYASSTGSGQLDATKRQRVCFVGDFGGSTETGLSYMELHEARPPSAKARDSSWLVLWLVKNVEPVDPPRLYSEFLSAKTGKPLGAEPHGPMVVRQPGFNP